MYNTRTTLAMSRANRRAHPFRCRGRVSPRRPGLSKVVAVVFNANGADGQLASATVGGEHRAPRNHVGPPIRTGIWALPKCTWNTCPVIWRDARSGSRIRTMPSPQSKSRNHIPMISYNPYSPYSSHCSDLAHLCAKTTDVRLDDGCLA